MANSEKNKSVSELNNRAVAYIDSGRYAEAIDLLTKALSLDPKRSGLLFNRAEAHRLSGNLAEARRDLLSELNLVPDSPEVLHGLGLIAYDGDDFELALEYYTKAIGARAEYAPAWNDLGVIAFRSQKYEDARAHFEKATALDADFSEAWFNLADTYDELGMGQKRAFALEQLKRARIKNGERWSAGEDE